ncbi:MAG TPA: flagellin [Mobilitalea sp.]|nr:flagellin [Mobilitalea sp.]
MRINHNISALRANNQLSRTNKLLDASLERLSSGYRINSAADDSAGLAISEKMRTQISGLEQAARNASDGISVIQTAEGALIEVESMLQRMRELSVQSANGIYTTEDRAAIQSEIDQLNEEINRISETTEFNTMTLLDGNIDRKSYSSNNDLRLVSLSDTVAIGDYGIQITQDARQAVLVAKPIGEFGDDPITSVPYDSSTRKITKDEEGSINVNGVDVEVKEGDTVDLVFEKLRNACDSVDINVFAIDPSVAASGTENLDVAGYTSVELVELSSALVFVSKSYGSDRKVELHCDNSNLSNLMGLSVAGVSASGFDAKAEPQKKDPTALDPDSLFENTATVTMKGNKITITDRNNFSMVFEVEPGTAGTKFEDKTIGEADPDLPLTTLPAIPVYDYVSVLNAGPMDLQIGASEGQIMSVRIPKVTPETLGIDKINIGTAEGAQEAIGLLDIAINQVSSIRSKLGAYQNRLEHSISNLDVTGENMTESLSRIEDVDMAEEMAEYTQKNVLAQAGTSMLAQANQRPQTILTLLQQ